MAADFGVYFESDRLPTLEQWEQAAKDLGVPLRVMPVDLKTHAGMLPVAFDADDWNTGFEFELSREWGRAPESAELLRGKDVFAWFRCVSREWPEAAWAAVAFAKASGGVFRSPEGVDFPTLDEAIAYAREESLPESEEEKAERAAKIKADQVRVEAVLREGERENRRKIKEGKACPNCGFSFGWNGRECNHCRSQNPYG